MYPRLFRKRDTVVTVTPAFAATSFMVEGLRIPCTITHQRKAYKNQYVNRLTDSAR
jgi:hypothetical protein